MRHVSLQTTCELRKAETTALKGVGAQAFPDSGAWGLVWPVLLKLKQTHEKVGMTTAQPQMYLDYTIFLSNISNKHQQIEILYNLDFWFIF